MHALAFTLHKTVAELKDTITMNEYLDWSAWFEEQALERKRAENRAKGIIDFSDPQATQQLLAQLGKG